LSIQLIMQNPTSGLLETVVSQVVTVCLIFIHKELQSRLTSRRFNASQLKIFSILLSPTEKPKHYSSQNYELTCFIRTLNLVSHFKERILVEKDVLRRTFGHQTEQATVGQNNHTHEKLQILYSSPDITRVIKSRRM
jgi:hypothetical protein